MFSESDAYEQFMGRWSRKLATAFAGFAEVRPGDAVLDAGSGTGALAAAVLTAGSARVVGIDPSGAYLQAARARIDDPRATFEEADVQRLPFPDATFDRALSMLVLNFVPDRARAVAELMRVTRPAGTVAAAVWDYGEGMEMLRAFWDEAVALEPSSDARDERHMPLSRSGELAALWQDQRLTDVRETALVVPLVFASFDDFWSPFLGGQGPAGALVASLADDRRDALRHRLSTGLVTARDGSLRLLARAWAVKGMVPAHHAPGLTG
jgi:SAM-dependent methyltransferase